MLGDIMGTFGMYQCTADEGTYVSTANQTIIGIHVDDLIGIVPTEAHLDRAERSVEGQVELDKRGKLSKMLGIELTWRKEQVVLTQTGFIESMTRQFLTTPVGKRSSLPLDPHSYASDELHEEDAKYQSIVGGLLFIARMTRPETSIHVNLLGRLTKEHTPKHYTTALRELEYLHSTKTEGIVLRKAEGQELEVNIYADASYGGEGSRSQTGVMITLGNQLIGLYTRRQEVVSLSITEAEYIADCEGAKDAAWIQQFLNELGITTNPILHTDIEGAYNLSKRSKFARRSRHIEHRYHYLRQQIRTEKLRIKTIPGKDNPADILTKLLPMSSVNGWKERWMSATSHQSST